MPRVDAPAAPSGSSGLISGSTGLVMSRSVGVTSAAITGSGIRAPVNGTKTPDLAGSDFVVLGEPKRQTVGILYARDGAGKTHWACAYCPEPVVVIGLDGRGERTIKKLLGIGRRIYYYDGKAPGNATQMSHDQAQQFGTEALAGVTRNFEWAIEKGIREWGKGTLVIDTSTELRDVVKLAVRGRVDRPNPRTGEKGDFGKSDAVINRTLKYFCDRARDSNLNLILLARSKPIYQEREDTGRITWETDKIFSQAADWIVGLNMVSGPSLGSGVQVLGMPGMVSAGPSKPTFELLVTNPKCAYEETGMVYREPDWGGEKGNPFAYAMTRLLPGSTEEDWR